MTRSLIGRRALVTGVTSGIGRATTLQLLECGASVVGLGRDPKKLKALSLELGQRFLPLTVDLSDAQQRQQVGERLAELPGPIDVFVSNAAECLYDTPLKLASGALTRLFEINVTALLDLCRAVVPQMTRGGHIVQLSSVTARHMPNPKFAPYSATKVAVEHLVQALRLELAPAKIQVSVVVPGLVDTPIYEKVAGFERALARLRDQVPTWLSADDVADTIIWVLSRPDHVVVSEVVVIPSGQTH